MARVKEWVWLSPSNKLHALHPRLNSVVACGADWDGWRMAGYFHDGKFTPAEGASKLAKCKNCLKMKNGFDTPPAEGEKEVK